MIEQIPIKDRESWLAMRRQDVTASDIGAICGVEAYRTALAVWLDKAGMSKQQEDNNLLRRGRNLEPSVLAYVREERRDWDVYQPGLYLRDPELRIGATPDAVARLGNGTEAIVQCKVVNKKQFDEKWADFPPMCYRLQAMTEAMLWGASTSYIAALVLTTYTADIHLFEVPRHPGAEKKIINDVAAFWEAITTGKQPRIDYKHDADLMAEIYAPKEAALDLSEDNRLPSILSEREHLMATKAETEKRLEEIRCEILDKIKGASRATLPGWRISYTMTNRKEYVVKAISYPTLRVSKAKEGKEDGSTT